MHNIIGHGSGSLRHEHNVLQSFGVTIVKDPKAANINQPLHALQVGNVSLINRCCDIVVVIICIIFGNVHTFRHKAKHCTQAFFSNK